MTQKRTNIARRAVISSGASILYGVPAQVRTLTSGIARVIRAWNILLYAFTTFMPE